MQKCIFATHIHVVIKLEVQTQHNAWRFRTRRECQSIRMMPHIIRHFDWFVLLHLIYLFIYWLPASIQPAHIYVLKLGRAERKKRMFDCSPTLSWLSKHWRQVGLRSTVNLPGLIKNEKVIMLQHKRVQKCAMLVVSQFNFKAAPNM